MFYGEEQSILELESQLPTSLKPLTDTMKIRQIFDYNETPIAYTDAYMIIADAVHTSKADAVQMHVLDAVHTPVTDAVHTPVSEAVQMHVPAAVLAHVTDARSSAGKSSSGNDIKDEDTFLEKKIQIFQKNCLCCCSRTALALQVDQIEDMDERLVGRYCIIDYDGLPYPGLILDVDEEGAEVSAMFRIGANRFYWPLEEDRLWYGRENIVT
ncbi:hypothetical protein MAR_000893 [Mya arenaria]|uniref:Uncharacterized protein n=1 Tax=Mya arenaria TaxID=6604 RepID=A0ABY7FA54_MYAAR|nr:hypothetical protein MAR_000893 [Mya arenaria]